MCPPNQIQEERTRQQITTAPLETREVPLYNRHAWNAPRQMDAYGTTQINSYENLYNQLQRLPAGPVAAGEPANAENLSYKERRRREQEVKRQKEEYKALGKKQSLLKMEEIASLPLFSTEYGREAWKEEKVSRSELTREQTMKRILEENDYSNFENLDGVMRNVVASSALSKFIKEYKVTKYSNPEDLCRKIHEREDKGMGVSGLLNPGLRLGLSLAQKTEGIDDDMKDFFRRLDEAMSTAVMVATVTMPPLRMNVVRYFQEKNVDNPEEKAEAAVQANKAQQIQIAKRLLLMQLSNFKKIDNEGKEEKWDKSMAVALSHCSRVVVTLPSQGGIGNTADQHADMWRSILTKNGANSAQDNRRGGSTHSVERRKVNDHSKITKEKKVLVNMIGQRGMNCAIGGLGYEGVGKKILCNDGSCGHFYSMYKEADSTHYGTFLMGLESDANGVTNQMGHTHDMHATPEKASSLGGQRGDEVGKKYGGRQCDLTHFTADQIAERMNQLEQYMERMQQKGFTAYDEYKGVMSMLAGKTMTRSEQVKFYDKTGVMPWGYTG